MGASGWVERVPFQDDIEGAFAALREQVFTRNGYWWSGTDDDEEPDGDQGSRPRSLHDLDALKATEEFWHSGTHSVLDMDRIDRTGTVDEPGVVRALPLSQVYDLFGSAEPSAADFDEAYEQDGGALGIDSMGWCGRYTVLYQDGAPHELVFWGISGD